MKFAIQTPPPAEKEIVLTLTLAEAKRLSEIARSYTISWPNLRLTLVEAISKASA